MGGAFGAQTTKTDLVVKHLRDASIGQQQLPFEHAITQLGRFNGHAKPEL